MTNCFPFEPMGCQKSLLEIQAQHRANLSNRIRGTLECCSKFPKAGMKSILVASSAVTFMDVVQNYPWATVRYPTKELCASWKGERYFLIYK